MGTHSARNIHGGSGAEKVRVSPAGATDQSSDAEIAPTIDTPASVAPSSLDAAEGEGDSSTETGEGGGRPIADAPADSGTSVGSSDGAALGDGAGSADSTGTTSTGGMSGATEGGYVVSGDWHGYAWTAAWPAGSDSAIAPNDFSANTVGFPFCATGTTAGKSDYSGGAEIGFNVNQAQGVNAPVMTWQPTTIISGGVLVNVSNPSNSTLQVYISGPNGSTDATDRWCATIGAFDREILIPWTTFNTACWDNSGTTYAGQSIQNVAVLVPGGTVSATFNYCVNRIASVGSASVLPATCAIPETWGTCASGRIACGVGACCSSSYPNYCSKTDLCYHTQEQASAACGTTACSACATPTNICPVPAGIGTCSDAGNLWCGGTVCCGSAYPYLCPATDMCYRTATDAAAACGSAACSTCKTTTACTKTCPTGQTLDRTTCTCLDNGKCTNACTGGGTPGSYPACLCPTCSPCPNGGTPGRYPGCLCPTCPSCPNGGTPGRYPGCLCPTCSPCPNGGTPGRYPGCLCPASCSACYYPKTCIAGTCM
jgi:hypothetical protein